MQNASVIFAFCSDLQNILRQSLIKILLSLLLFIHFLITFEPPRAWAGLRVVLVL